MKHAFLSLVLLALTTQIAFIQKPSKCKLLDEHGSIFHAHYYQEGDFKTVLWGVDSLPAKHCLAAWVNPNHYSSTT